MCPSTSAYTKFSDGATKSRSAALKSSQFRASFRPRNDTVVVSWGSSAAQRNASGSRTAGRGSRGISALFALMASDTSGPCRVRRTWSGTEAAPFTWMVSVMRCSGSCAPRNSANLPVGSSRSRKRSSTSAPTLVSPQAMNRLRPIATAGAPGCVVPCHACPTHVNCAENTQPVVRVRRHEFRHPLCADGRNDLVTKQLERVVPAQIPRHHLDPHENVGTGPWSRLEAEQREFRRQLAAVVRRNERVDAGDIRVDLLPGALRQRGPRGTGGATKADRAKKAILRQRHGAEDLGQPAMTNAP